MIYEFTMFKLIIFGICGPSLPSLEPMDQVFTELRNDGTTLPLFIKPKNGQDSAEFIIQWIGENKELLKQKILEHGGCLTKLVCIAWITRLGWASQRCIYVADTTFILDLQLPHPLDVGSCICRNTYRNCMTLA